MSILRPGTGTNYYYAKKHGELIRNMVDAIGLTFSDSYSPTYAGNSLDALETLCKVAPEDRPRSAYSPGADSRAAVSATPEQAAPAKPKDEPTMDHGSTFGFPRQADQTQQASVPLAASKVLNLTAEQMEEALGPTNGWSAEDSRRQIDALHHCQQANPAAPMREGFNQSIDLGNSSFSKTGWSTGIVMASIVGGGIALATAPLWAPLLIAVGGGAAAAHLIKSAHEETNDGNILRDMSTRLHQKAHGITEERHRSHGNYEADFSV